MYNLYLKEDWEAMLALGHKILANTDYLYLRQRMGVAYMAQKAYPAAIQQLEKALYFDETSAFTLGYLYSAYLAAGQKDKARQLYPRLTSAQKEYFASLKPKTFDYVYTEAGTKQSSTPETVEPMTYAQVGLGMNLGKHLHLYQAISGLKQVNDGLSIQQGEYLAAATLGLGPFYLTPTLHLSSTSGTATDYSLAQNGYAWHIGLGYSGKTWTVQPFFSQIRLKDDLTTAGEVSSRDLIANQYGLTVAKQLGKLWLSGSGWLHEWNDEQNWAGKVTATLPIGKKLSLTSHFYMGNNFLFTEDAGTVLYNSPDVTKLRTGALATYNLSKKYAVYGLYQFQKMEKTDREYTYNMFLGGLKIKF